MPLAPKIRFKITDNDGDVANTEIHVQSGDTIAQYDSFAEDYALLLDPIILGAIDPIAVMTIPVDISGLTGNTLNPVSDVEQIGAFQFADTNNEPVDVNVPGILLSTVLGSSDELDTADTDVAAFIALMESGDGTISPSSVSEADIVDTFYARKETRASGKRRT